MPELLQEYWILILVALVIGVVVAWWIFHASRRTKVELEDKPDGESAAKRNQALIDAPAAAAGAVSAAANSDDVAAAPAVADAEAGPAISPQEAPVAPETAPPPPREAAADDLRRIKGVGPKLVTLLAENGVTRFAQIAAWDEAEIDRIDAKLGRFEGRIRRDNWVEQARLLAADDIAGYEARFGNL